MAIKIENFRTVNKDRGNAKLLATFSVNFGPLEINGFELVKTGKSTFVSSPHRRYNAGTDAKPEWKNFNFVWFSGTKGEEMKRDIEQAAIEEFERRGGGEEDRSNKGGRSKGYGQTGGYGNYRSRAADDDFEDMPF